MHRHLTVMGWKLLFLIFAVAAAYEDDIPDSFNPECMEEFFRQCESKLREEELEMPKNAAELKEACKIAEEYLVCATNIFDNCEISDEIAKPFYIAKKVMKNICDENSELFEAVSQNIGCFGENVDYFHEPCPLTPKETQDVNDLVNAFSAADEGAFLNSDMCLESLTRIGCMVSKLGDKCGADAVYALIEILEQLEKPFERCGPAVKENLILIAGLLDTEEELAEDLAEMKKRKR